MRIRIRIGLGRSGYIQYVGGGGGYGSYIGSLDLICGYVDMCKNARLLRRFRRLFRSGSLAWS